MSARRRTEREKAAQFIREGDMLIERGKFLEAIERYRQAVELDSRDPRSRTRLADAYAYADQASQAAAEYEHAIKVDPTYAEAHFGLGELFFHHGRIRAAIHYFARAVRLSPRRAWYHYKLSQAYIEAGKLDKAERALKRAIMLMPDGFYFFRLGDLYLQMERLPEARWALEQACLRAPWDEYYHACLGLLCWRLKDMKRAIQALSKAVSIRPEAAPYHFLLAEALREAGEIEKARERMKQVPTLDEYDRDFIRRLIAWAGLTVSGEK